MSEIWKAVQRQVGVAADGVPGPATANAVAKALGLHSAMDSRGISDKGLAALKSFEGLKLNAYPDPGSGGAPWTIGYGHTGPEVKPGLVISQRQADAYLKGDVSRFETAVRRLAPNTTPGQFDALVSLAYNIGENALANSTLLRLHNEGKYAESAAQFHAWRFASGKELPGLVKRRAVERALYEG